jgi:hypothetical protein
MTTENTYTEAEVVGLLREGQGELSQKDYAKALKLSPQYLSDIYANRRPPGPSVLAQLDMERVYRKKAPKKPRKKKAEQ